MSESEQASPTPDPASEVPSAAASVSRPYDFAADEPYRDAVVDLLGVIAYGELAAFESLANDAEMAPTLADRLELCAMASNEFGHIEPLVNRLRELGADPVASMESFRTAFEQFHRRTAPRDWYEGLIKAYVGDGLAADFYREIAAYLDPDTRTLIVEALEESGQSAFVVDRVRRAIEADHRVAGRLALWGRRLMGEALSQAQRVAADRDALTTLLVGSIDRPAMDLAAMGRMFTRLTENHTQRMRELGLDA